MNRAAMNVHFDSLKWLHKYRRDKYLLSAAANGAGIGGLDILRWLMEERDFEFTWQAFTMKAALDRHFEVILFLEFMKQDVSRFAASGGHLGTLR